MNNRKEDIQHLSVTELQPFKVYKTIYTYMYFKKIDNKIFMSSDNVTYRRSIISFMPQDKVFKEVV